MTTNNSGGNMPTDNYKIKGFIVDSNGFVRNSSGEYIGQLSDLEECEARGKEIAKLKKQVTRFINSEKQISDAYLRIRTLVDAWDTNEGGENRFEVTENKIKDLKKQVDKLSGSYGWVSYEKMADENRELKKQLEEKEGRIQAINRDRSILRDVIKAKDELLEKMRVASENLCEWVSDLRNVSNLSPEIIPNVWGRIANCYSSSVRCREALALLSKSLPKPLNKDVKE